MQILSEQELMEVDGGSTILIFGLAVKTATLVKAAIISIGLAIGAYAGYHDVMKDK